MTTKIEVNSIKQSEELINSWERQLQALDERLSAYGPMVEVMEASDTEEYKVTFPPNRQKSSPQKTAKKRTKFRITVDYGYDTHSVVVSQALMDQINLGEPITIDGQGFSIEGKMTQDTWSFNCSSVSSLTVDGEDGRQIYIGKLSAAYIAELDQ